jgi:hypothetical protein
MYNILSIGRASVFVMHCYYLFTPISCYFISHSPCFGNDVHYIIIIYFISWLGLCGVKMER